MPAGFNNITEYVNALAKNGQVHSTTFRKVPSQASTASIWVDLSMAAGFPLANYYAAEPLVAAVLSSRKGIFFGFDRDPAKTFLTHLGLTTPTAAFVGQFQLLDYVLFYPFVDMDSLDLQEMDNTVTLPRYTDGIGLQVMAVAVTPSVGGGAFTFDYINQDGNLKTSPVQTCNTAAVSIASLVTSAPATNAQKGPFLTLASGDYGVRSIVSITNTVANGGLISLVLVKPLCDSVIREINTTREINFLQHNMVPPRIIDGAYLNMICYPAGSVAAGLLLGQAKFVWN
jgi:hypothetical protein